MCLSATAVESSGPENNILHFLLCAYMAFPSTSIKCAAALSEGGGVALVIMVITGARDTLH